MDSWNLPRTFQLILFAVQLFYILIHAILDIAFLAINLGRLHFALADRCAVGQQHTRRNARREKGALNAGQAWRTIEKVDYIWSSEGHEYPTFKSEMKRTLARSLCSLKSIKSTFRTSRKIIQNSL
jgi:hypothetical protein